MQINELSQKIIIMPYVSGVRGEIFGSLCGADNSIMMIHDGINRPMQDNYVNELSEKRRDKIIAKIEANWDKYNWFIIYGKFLMTRYSTVFTEAKKAMYFREPKDRFMLHYDKWSKRKDKKSSISKEMKEKKMKHDDLAKVEKIKNIYAYYLNGIDVNTLDFVGIAEQFNKGVRLFKAIFGLSEMLEDNKRGDIIAYEIDSSLQNTLEHEQDKDGTIYQNALNRFNTLCSGNGIS